MSRHVNKIPKNHPVQPLKPRQAAEDRATCGQCGLSWDNGKVTSMTPAPSGRCPFEDYHVSKCTCILKVVVEYDPSVTDAESVASALDTLMETALSTPDILEEYGNPDVGEFLILADDVSTYPI